MFVLHILRFFHNSTDFPDFSCPKSPEIPKKSKIGKIGEKSGKNRIIGKIIGLLDSHPGIEYTYQI